MALLLATGETLVDAALGEGRVDVERGHRGLDLFDPVPQFRRLAANGGCRRAQEVRHRDTGHLDGILHGQKQAGPRTFVDAHRQHVRAVEGNGARRHVVFGMARDGVGQRRLARAVGSHQGMCLTGFHGEVDAAQDRDLVVRLRGVLHADVQVLNFQNGHETVVFSVDSVISSSCSMAAVRRSRTSGTAILAMISPKKPRTTSRRACASGIPRERR
ncbi:Uncharacterised protein [Mycobacterium tuberculosis]|nr:Uncharacterised protein [Mycobacterium tuberculosis]CKR37903.1 Uncharacterised protein [Mycobacterium tuberculosis]